MAVLSLAPGPGNTIKDTLVPVLLGTVVAGAQPTEVDFVATSTVAYKEVGYLWDAAVVIVETGTITSTGANTTGDIEIFAADDAVGTNAVSLGTFETLEDGTQDDDLVLALHVRILRPFVGAVVTVAGTTPVVPLICTLRDKDFAIDDDRSA